MPNTKPTPDTGGIPDFLRRDPTEKPAPVAASPIPAKMSSTPPMTAAQAETAKPNRATRRAVASTKQAKPAKAPKAAKQTKAKPAKVAAEDTDEDTDEDEADLPKSIVPAKYKAQYAETEDTCGTALSLALKEATTHKSKEQAGRVVLDVDALWKIAARNKVDVAKYVDLNNGQKRMNVYNRLVGLLNNGTNVHIGSKTFKAEDWVPRKPTAPKKAKAKKHVDQPQAHAA